MRCYLGPKKLRKLSQLFGKDFKLGMTRGNSDHRVELWEELKDNRWFAWIGTSGDDVLWFNGEVEGPGCALTRSYEEWDARETFAASTNRGVI